MEKDKSDLFRFCPKCGSSGFETKNKGRSYQCGSCFFQYYVNSSAAVACLIFNESGELMLTRRAFEPNKGMLDLPGGFIEPMETAENAVIREIKEELNLDISELEYLISFPNLYPFSNFTVPTADLAFLCKVVTFIGIKPGDDVASIEFILPEKIDLNSLCADSMRKIILYYLNNYKTKKNIE
jgi:NAD+ diphosphatase